MSNDDSISNSIKQILINGINLNLDSIEEEQFYITKLIDYFEDETEFTAYLRKDNTMEIEDKEMQLAMDISIFNSTLFMTPYKSDIMEIFTQVLTFISARHLAVVSEFRGIEEIRIQSIQDVNKGIHEKEDYETEEESSDDDDYEWI